MILGQDFEFFHDRSTVLKYNTIDFRKKKLLRYTFLLKVLLFYFLTRQIMFRGIKCEATP